jgi:transcription elongation factor GreA
MLDIKKRLQDELQQLDYELKVTLPKEILRAREHGDLRENAEYKAAKERQSFLQARIAQMHRRLAALLLVNLDKIPRDKVGLGSLVTVKHEDTGE